MEEQESVGRHGAAAHNDGGDALGTRSWGFIVAAVAAFFSSGASLGILFFIHTMEIEVHGRFGEPTTVIDPTASMVLAVAGVVLFVVGLWALSRAGGRSTA